MKFSILHLLWWYIWADNSKPGWKLKMISFLCQLFCNAKYFILKTNYLTFKIIQMIAVWIMLACIFKGYWTSIKTFQTPCYYHDSWRWSWSQSDDQCPRCLFCCWCTCGLWGNFYQVNKSPLLIINILNAFWLVVAFSCSLIAALVSKFWLGLS